jgi:outer membrane receptor protein involved in Fe transport
MFLCGFSLTAQDTTFVDTTKIRVQDLPYMKVKMPSCVALIVKERPLYNSLLEKDIEQLGVDDVGDLLIKMPGVSMKSYGSLGAMKTISTRGLGGEHSSIVLDGIEISNAQSGVVNLSQIQPEGLTHVHSGQSIYANLQPVSAVISGNSVVFRSFIHRWNAQPLKLRTSFKYGSFNRMEGFAGFSTSMKKWSVGAYGKVRSSDGAYPYSVTNGNTNEDGIRVNNDFFDASLNMQVQYIPEYNKRYRVGYRGSYVDQGLPGAVILYNETADERMKTNDHTVFSDFYWRTSRGQFYRIYGSFNQNQLNYIDTSYFNAEGGINDEYLNRGTTIGVVAGEPEWKHFRFRWGIESKLNTLQSQDTSFNRPVRSHSSLYGSFQRYIRIGDLEVVLPIQFIHNQTREGQDGVAQYFRPTPMVKFRSRTFRRRSKVVAWYKHSFRLPTFNELYYNSIGNVELLPESAHQVNLGGTFTFFDDYSSREWTVRGNGFFNRVENKIVAIPTKNLFLWSMMNVENVNVFGGELSSLFKYNFSEWIVSIQANYTYQKSIDVTPESLNYGDQIAYIPEHIANFDVSLDYRGYSMRIGNNYSSLRYALNENIDPNIVPGFLVTDISANYTFKLKKQNSIKIQAKVKNVFNQTYAHIRSFVMPGRNYLISLHYAIN